MAIDPTLANLFDGNWIQVIPASTTALLNENQVRRNQYCQVFHHPSAAQRIKMTHQLARRSTRPSFNSPVVRGATAKRSRISPRIGSASARQIASSSVTIFMSIKSDMSKEVCQVGFLLSSFRVKLGGLFHHRTRSERNSLFKVLAAERLERPSNAV